MHDWQTEKQITELRGVCRVDMNETASKGSLYVEFCANIYNHCVQLADFATSPAAESHSLVLRTLSIVSEGLSMILSTIPYVIASLAVMYKGL